MKESYAMTTLKYCEAALNYKNSSINSKETCMSVEKIHEAMDTVEITRKEYNRLVKDSEWLSCLEAAGVDNWEGYDSAIEMLHGDEDEDDA